MKFVRGIKDGKALLKFNDSLYLSIPSEAHSYKVCGWSPVEWVVDRYGQSGCGADKESGIFNDSNDWGIEHDEPAYVLSLVKKTVTVGVESSKIIASLPSLKYNIDEQPLSGASKHLVIPLKGS